MTTTQTAMGIAALLSIVWITLGFGNLILVVLALLVGAAVGRYLEGRLDVSAIVDAVRGRRSSS